MDDIEKKNLQVDERLRLIDVSSEDDSLIFDVSGSQNEQEYFELSEVLNAQEKEDASTFSREREQDPVLYESLEPERMSKASKCNLRKSLTWDSAFFTSDGVLDPEELSIINCGLKKADKHPLPSIQEDLRRSTESISTLDSDNLSLESLEVDLFADIRASIQRSSIATNLACSGIKTRPQKSGIQSLHPSRKMDIASRNKMKLVPLPKRQSVNVQGSEKTKKEALNRPRAIQATAKSEEQSTSSLRPPKILGRVDPVSAAASKRTSIGPNHIKSEAHAPRAPTGKGGPSIVPRKAGLSIAQKSTTPSPNSSSSSSISITKIESAASCSSHDRSGSTSSGSTGKSPLKTMRNRTSSRNVNPAQRSTIKTPPKVSSKNKMESGNSRLATYLKSASKISSSISPTSSIDGWSSESSSSTSTVNQRSNSSKTSLDSPRKGFYLERDAAQIFDIQNYQHDQPCVGYERTISPKVVKGTPEAGGLSHADAPRSVKPSALRMPSPKIGFFDAEKSMVHTPNSGLQFHPGARSGIPKHGSGSSSLPRGAIKAMPGKNQPAITLTTRSSTNYHPHSAGVRHIASSTKPTTLAQVRELSKAPPKELATPRTRERSPGIISKLEDDTSLQTGKGICLKSGDRNFTKTNRDSLGFSQNAGHKSFKSGMITENEELVHIKSLKCTPTKEDVLHNSHKSSSGCDYEGINSSKNSGETPLNGENHLDERNLKSLHGSDEKEKSVSVENQLDCFSSHMINIDLRNEEGFNEKNILSLSQFGVDNTDNPGDAKSTSPQTGNQSYLEDGKRELTRESLGSFPNDGEKSGQYALKDMIPESEELIHVKSLKSTPTKEGILENSHKASPGCDYGDINPLKISGEMPRNGENHFESNLNLCHKSNEKENSLSFENQVDMLSRHMGSIDLDKERFSWKHSSFPSPFDVNTTDNSGHSKLALLDSRKALVNGQEDFSKDISKCNPLPLSSISTDSVPIERTPLAAKLSSCNGSESFELAVEPMQETSAFPFSEGAQADNSCVCSEQLC